MNIWRGYGLRINATGFDPAVTVGGVTNYGIESDFEINRDYVDGSPYPRFAGIRGVEESISLTSVNPDDCIDYFGTVGACLQGDSADDGVDFYLAQYDECGAAPIAGSVHRRYGIDFVSAGPPDENRGMILPESMSCDHRADLTYNLSVLPRSVDGTSSALTVTDSVALESIQDNLKRFTLAPNTVIAGIPLTAFKNVTMNFGNEILRESGDSAIFDQYIGIERITATIDVMGIDPLWIGAAGIPNKGVFCDHADTEFYFRRRGDIGSADSDFYPNASAVHIKATCAGVATPMQYATGSATAATQTGLRITCTYDGTNLPIIVNTEQAIP